MASTVRIPTEIYEQLREINVLLESKHQSAAPTIQDLVSVAVNRLITDWNDDRLQPKLLEELLEHRKDARARMGKRQVKNKENT